MATKTQSQNPPTDDAKTIVSNGYDILSYHYRDNTSSPKCYSDALEYILPHILPTSSILDLGCGCGVPVARDFAAAGHSVTGLDISGVQIARAKSLIPSARFIQADMATASEDVLGFSENTFDAIVCLYVLLHVPFEDQKTVFERVCRWLKPGGVGLFVTGEEQMEKVDENWLQGGAKMYWYQPGHEASQKYIVESGMTILESIYLPDDSYGEGGHRLFLVKKGV